MHDCLRSSLPPGRPSGGDVIQLPIRLRREWVDQLFSEVSDDDGLPCLNFPDGTHTACSWDELLPMVREWLEAGAHVIYYSIDFRFDFYFSE